MRLTQIKLAGFKSFTDPTTIHVPGQLVAVIGPNGCGKSNVIDAVRWVLGEASAKQLRGESMQDVIFNGAATRRPAPRASVELVFDNSNHSLQGAWGQYAEVSIKRQLTRQGESSYYINGQAVRRRDITDLFLGTGVGARGYAVIEQGMISRIIEARPEELRAYIEEAAGVSKYKERRRETEARLKDSREHLQRLADLQNELARQVEKLEKQAGTAERYRSLQDELADQQNLSDYAQWQAALQQADAAQAAHDEAQAAQSAAQEQATILAESMAQTRETELAQQQQLHSLNQEHALLREQTARVEEQLRAWQNQQQRMERDRTSAQVALQKIAQEQAALRDECDLLAEEMAAQQETLSELAMMAAEQEAQLPEYETAQFEIQQAHQNQQDELNRLRRELAVKQQQLQHTEQSLTALAARQNRLHNEQSSLNLPPETELAAAQENAQTLQMQYETAEAALLEQEQQLAQAQQHFQAANAQHNRHYRAQLAAQTQQEALAQLLSGNPEQNFWQATDFAAAPVLWQHIQVPSEWQHALGVVLAERAEARLLPEHAALPQPLPQGAAAWVNVSGSLNKKNQPAQALINQIRCDKNFQAALNHWLDGILCAPDLNYALSQQHNLEGKQSWLTPEGHRIDRFGAVLFDPDNGKQMMAQKIRHEALTQELAELAPILAHSESELAAAEAAQSQAEEQMRHSQAQQRRLAADLQQAQNRANQLFARTNQGQLRREHIKTELAQLDEENRTLSYTADTLRADLDTLTQSLAELEQQFHHLSGSLNERQQRFKQAQLALLETNRRYGAAEIALHKQQQKQDSLNSQITVLEQQKLDWQERQSELALNAENQDDALWLERLEELGEMAFALQEQIQAAQNHLQQTQTHGRQLFEQQQTLSANQPALQQNVQAALLQQQEALLHAKRHHDSLNDKQADLAALAERQNECADLAALTEKIAALTRKIQALGAVNLAALDELNEAQERDAYYRNQSQDVQAAIALLEEAIAQIDNETKARFKETFDAVNDKVQTFFPTLFGGGEAKLHMVGDDLLSAGVSIMARPPGKKNSTIHLLSGGEKALTAMSLVFALFSLNPAPFCLLDEVDAPLDDANTGRFCNLVKEMSAQTQFLYISHNRLTMEMAEQLIGVTMQEKGVSRIVAVDIQQAISMAEN